MKRTIPIFAVIALLAVTAFAQGTRFTLKSAEIASRSSIKLEQVFNSFGCSGQNISPSLEWAGVPAAAKSLALIVHDPDAPTGVGGFTHWIVYNIPVSASKLERWKRFTERFAATRDLVRSAGMGRTMPASR
jgi:phosphatidylethanolamine-binding protein (PEBP) family uncharacterized protein